MYNLTLLLTAEVSVSTSRALQSCPQRAVLPSAGARRQRSTGRAPLQPRLMDHVLRSPRMRGRALHATCRAGRAGDA